MEPLTSQQSQLLEFLLSQRLVSVQGCAGSGKTTLAAALAAQLAGEGFRVLLLCRNPYLAEKLRRQLAGAGVDVFAFTAFIKDLLRNDRSPDVFVPRAPAGWEAPWTQYDAPSQNDLRRALDALYRADLSYEAVIIDEGQDFETGWMEIAEACLVDNGTSRFVIFFDDHPQLTAFGASRMYADLQAPVSLSCNCRSAGELDGMLRKLHPGITQPGLNANEKGILREWIYEDEAELFDKLHQALLAVEEFYPRLEDVVVLTAESASSRLSKFSGLVIDSPRLRASPAPGRLDWRAAVLGYLQGFGLVESALSDQPAPSPEDIRRVNKFCRAYQSAHRRILSRQPGYLSKDSLSWHMDSFGALRLRYAKASVREIPPVDLLKFFGSPGWADTLPSPYMRYRLTTDEDWADYPHYYRLKLLDLPSFSGLEAEAVVFVLHNYFAGNEDDLKAMLYLALSRPRHMLHIVTPFSIRDLIADSC
jgi:hypothetical protein